MRVTTFILSLMLSGCSTLDLWTVDEAVGCASDSKTICIEITGPSMTPTEFEQMLMRHEGFRRHPYSDAGFQSIGFGRNLTTNGISEEEALELLRNDVARIASELAVKHPVVKDLKDVRYYVLVSMAYTMGVNKIGEFKLMWAAIEKRDWQRAALEMYLSKWCGDVRDRCSELADMMETGVYNS